MMMRLRLLSLQCSISSGSSRALPIQRLLCYHFHSRALTHTSSSFYQGAANASLLDSIGPLPSEVMPSTELVGHFTKKMGTKNCDRLAQLIAEVEFLYFISNEVPSRLSNNEWLELVDTPTTREREHYLRDLYQNERVRNYCETRNAEFRRMQQLRHQEMQTRLSNGEMVYSRSFHSLLGEIQGDSFRTMVDRVYGSRCEAALRVEDPRPKLLVDCRFLRFQKTNQIQQAVRQINELYEAAVLLHDRPFELHMVNLYMEKAIARAIKASWHFLFGPEDPTMGSMGGRIADSQLLGKLDEAEELGLLAEEISMQQGSNLTANADGRIDRQLEVSIDAMHRERSKKVAVLERRSDFIPHPFCPRITTKSIRRTLKELQWEEEGEKQKRERERWNESCEESEASGVGDYENSQVAYISPDSKYFLPDDLSHFRVFILPATEVQNNSQHSSLAAALHDKIPVYRLPLQKYVAQYQGDRWRIPLATQANIIHAVYSQRMGWADAFRTYIPQRFMTPEPFILTGLEKIRKQRRVPPPKSTHTGEANLWRGGSGKDKVEEPDQEGGLEEDNSTSNNLPPALGDFGENYAEIPMKQEVYDEESGEFIVFRGEFDHSFIDPCLTRDVIRKQRDKLLYELELDRNSRRMQLKPNLSTLTSINDNKYGHYQEAKAATASHSKQAHTILGTPPPKKKRVHRYSREQRDELRRQMAKLSSPVINRE